MQSSDENPTPVSHTAKSARFVISVPLSRLRRHLILSAIVAVLGFALFVLAFLWDQDLWMGVIALFIGLLAALYALWCLRTLSTPEQPSAS